MSEAMQALYAGDPARARALLAPDDRLDVFEAAAFGRLDRLAAILTQDGTQASARSEDGFSALHLAIFGGQPEAAQLLIARGADLEAVSQGDIARVRPLGTAAFVRSCALAELLLDAGADPDGRGDGGFTPLHAAAANGDAPLIRLLLARGADPGATADDGRTPADLAADDGVRALLSA
jgi:ankyrin repeat protein